jgi:PAS domain
MPDAEPTSDPSLTAQNLPGLDPSSLRAERLRVAYGYWLGKRQGRMMPCRSDIEPVEIPALLPYVMLIDVIADPLDFRYRLIGTAARNVMRRDYTAFLGDRGERQRQCPMAWVRVGGCAARRPCR